MQATVQIIVADSVIAQYLLLFLLARQSRLTCGGPGGWPATAKHRAAWTACHAMHQEAEARAARHLPRALAAGTRGKRPGSRHTGPQTVAAALRARHTGLHHHGQTLLPAGLQHWRFQQVDSIYHRCLKLLRVFSVRSLSFSLPFFSFHFHVDADL